MGAESNIEEIKKKLEEELAKLEHEYKYELPKQIADARELGDLKENAEYHAARERMSYVKAKMAQIVDKLSRLNDINFDDIPTDRVGFGSTVVIQDVETGEEMTFTFVSREEIDPMVGKITLATPYGKALIDKKEGDEVEVSTPAGTRKFIVKSITTIHSQNK